MKKILLIILLISPFLIKAQTDTFYCCSMHTYTVPVGVNSIDVDIQGATGGLNSIQSGDPNRGGGGARVQCILTVTPGQVLYIFIGGAGTIEFPGGGNGGGAGGYYYYGAAGSGGGASDIRIGGTSLTDRVIVAGGGGGASIYVTGSTDYARGGDGGGIIGENGLSNNSDTNGKGGAGGTQTMGGIGGMPSGPCINSGTAGSLGNGGDGAQCANSFPGVGGGGGGGYYGGGGGGFGGGGGGSSYTDSVLATSVIHTRGYNTSGNGLLIISTTTSVKEINKNESINLSPNPVTSQLNIQSTNTPITQLTITNLLGQTLYTQQYNTEKVQIDVSTLPPGLYFVKVNNTDVRKFVKQ